MDVKKLVRMKRNILEKESLEDSDARKMLHTVIVDIHSSKKKLIYLPLYFIFFETVL